MFPPQKKSNISEPNHPFFIGFSTINQPFWGTPHLWKPPFLSHFNKWKRLRDVQQPISKETSLSSTRGSTMNWLENLMENRPETMFVSSKNRLYIGVFCNMSPCCKPIQQSFCCRIWVHDNLRARRSYSALAQVVVPQKKAEALPKSSECCPNHRQGHPTRSSDLQTQHPTSELMKAAWQQGFLRDFCLAISQQQINVATERAPSACITSSVIFRILHVASSKSLSSTKLSRPWTRRFWLYLVILLGIQHGMWFCSFLGFLGTHVLTLRWPGQKPCVSSLFSIQWLDHPEIQWMASSTNSKVPNKFGVVWWVPQNFMFKYVQSPCSLLLQATMLRVNR